MDKVYIDNSKILKAISNPKRLRIIDMLSCGEMCACNILEAFNISQPTLSHDIKLLVDASLVNQRRDGKNIYYSLNTLGCDSFMDALSKIFTETPDCICHKGSCSKSC